MKTLSLVATSMLLLGSAELQADLPPKPDLDLRKIDRSIAKEPEYRSTPKYCLLVLGQQAANRVWLVLDGDRIFVDQNGNGDLTEAGEQYEVAGSRVTIPFLLSPNGRYQSLRIYRYENHRVRVIVKVGGQTHYVGFSRTEKPTLSPKAATAPIIHFDGPLTIGQYAEPLVIDRSTNESLTLRKRAFRIMIGSRGLGAGTFAAMHCRCRRSKGPLLAKFSFPPSRTGEMPIEISESLKTSS